jgi:hypothetical protein
MSGMKEKDLTTKIRIRTTTSPTRETIYLVPVCFIIVLPCVLVMGCLLVAHRTMVNSPFVKLSSDYFVLKLRKMP